MIQTERAEALDPFILDVRAWRLPEIDVNGAHGYDSSVGRGAEARTTDDLDELPDGRERVGENHRVGVGEGKLGVDRGWR